MRISEHCISNTTEVGPLACRLPRSHLVSEFLTACQGSGPAQIHEPNTGASVAVPRKEARNAATAFVFT